MKTVFVDVDSQFDFLCPAGALYVPGAETIVPVIARLNRHAAAHGIPIVSTTDAHTEHDPEFATWPHHCVWGTLGQRKAESTLIAGAKQIIVKKQTIDVFAAPTINAVLDELSADAYVVYGVVTEICVRSAALGLLKRGKAVTIVTDAIKELTVAGRRAALTELTTAGATLTTASTIMDR